MSLQERINFGWLPDLPDFRDRLAFPPGLTEARVEPKLPLAIDLREKHTFNVLDQGYIGSCVAHAVGSAIEFAQHTRIDDPTVSDFLEEDRKFQISRLFLYYEARRAIGLTHEDSGCHIRDAMRAAYNVGVPRETGWKYDESKFAIEPPKRQYRSAPFHKITSYQAVKVSVEQVKRALSTGHPVVFGVSLFNTFFTAERTGMVPMPSYSDQYIGGHAMLVVGYDDKTQRFTVLNSWGIGWGRDGYCFLPYAYIGNPQLGADYWILTDDLYKERMP